MSGTRDAIMDAAERRIREAGYGGFSFREIAADVGVKSASVHYHFAAKEDLAAAVARRYADRVLAAIEADVAAGRAPDAAWKDAFRQALRDNGAMCLCGVLGATSHQLPEAVRAEARRFFEAGEARLGAGGLSREDALRLIATLEGALLVANALARPEAFDAATSHIG